MSDQIGTIETYRGVGIHDCQPRDRVETAVKPAIDEVFGMSAIDELLLCCGDVTRPPEARLLAAAKLEAGHQIAAAERRVRPAVDLERVGAMVAGLNSRAWRSPFHYGSLLDGPPRPGQPQPVPRPDAYFEQVEEDQRALHSEERAGQ